MRLFTELYIDALIGINRFKMKVNELLDNLSVWFLRKTLSINGYYVAGFFLATLSILTVLDYDNPIFAAIMKIVPFMGWQFWAIIFALGSVLVSRVQANRYEIPTLFFFFIGPVVTFYGFLLFISVSARSRPFTNALILFALVMPIIIVIRTSAFRFYREYCATLELRVRSLTDENTRLKKDLDESRRHEQAPDSSTISPLERNSGSLDTKGN